MTRSDLDPERDAFDERPSADEMLARIHEDGDHGGRGRLRVYLGMAPGVGKTFRMLEEGHRRRSRGTDVVIGFVEAHGRPRTIEAIGDLEVVPRLRLEYRSVAIEDLDTEAVIRRRPTVALDEDVERIRDAGIHVVTTLNIQHIDSLAAAVETITGAPVRERLPDEVLANADEVELVDMSPHALRQRMRHGNVYPPDRTAIALDRFFTEANLTSLRDLALRAVARKVEDELEDGRASRPSQTAGVTDRVAVLVDGAPGTSVAVRRAAELASEMHGMFLAIVPDLAASSERDHLEARAIREDAAVAGDLGALVARVDGTDLASELVTLVRARGINHLVIAHRPTTRMERLRGATLLERLGSLPGLEVHLIVAPDEPRRTPVIG